MARSPGTKFSLVITALVTAVGMINITFWQVIASKKLLVPDVLLPFFPMLRSGLALLFFFTVIPRVTGENLKRPLLLGFAAYLCGQTLLILTPAGPGAATYGVLCVSLLFDGFGGGILAMLAESLVALHVDKAERARVMAIQHMLIMAATAPFGWISGALSDISRGLPFALSLVLLTVGLVVTVKFYAQSPGAGRASNPPALVQ
jgi:hypothetical protein